MRVWCGNCIGNRYEGRFDDIKKELDSVRMEMEGLVGISDVGACVYVIEIHANGN